MAFPQSPSLDDISDLLGGVFESDEFLSNSFDCLAYTDILALPLLDSPQMADEQEETTAIEQERFRDDSEGHGEPQYTAEELAKIKADEEQGDGSRNADEVAFEPYALSCKSSKEQIKTLHTLTAEELQAVLDATHLAEPTPTLAQQEAGKIRAADNVSSSSLSTNTFSFDLTDRRAGVVTTCLWYDPHFDFSCAPFVGMEEPCGDRTDATDSTLSPFVFTGDSLRFLNYQYSVDSSLLPTPSQPAIFYVDRWYAHWCRHANIGDDRHPVCFRCQISNGLPVCFVNTTWPCEFCLLSNPTKLMARTDKIHCAIQRYVHPDSAGWDLPSHASRRLPKRVKDQIDALESIPPRLHCNLTTFAERRATRDRRKRAVKQGMATPTRRGSRAPSPAAETKETDDESVDEQVEYAQPKPIGDEDSESGPVASQSAEKLPTPTTPPPLTRDATVRRKRRDADGKIELTDGQGWCFRGKLVDNRDIVAERYAIYIAVKRNYVARAEALGRSTQCPILLTLISDRAQKIWKEQLDGHIIKLPQETTPLPTFDERRLYDCYADGEHTPPPTDEDPVPEDYEPPLPKRRKKKSKTTAKSGTRAKTAAASNPAVTPVKRKSSDSVAAGPSGEGVGNATPPKNVRRSRLDAHSKIVARAMTEGSDDDYIGLRPTLITPVKGQEAVKPYAAAPARPPASQRRERYLAPRPIAPHGHFGLVVKGAMQFHDFREPARRLAVKAVSCYNKSPQLLETEYNPFDRFNMRAGFTLVGRQLGQARNGFEQAIDRSLGVTYQYPLVPPDPDAPALLQKVELALRKQVMDCPFDDEPPTFTKPEDWMVDLNPYYVHETPLSPRPLRYGKEVRPEQHANITEQSPVTLSQDEAKDAAAYPREVFAIAQFFKAALRTSLADSMHPDLREVFDHGVADLTQGSLFHAVLTERQRQRSALTPPAAVQGMRTLVSKPLRITNHLIDLPSDEKE